MPIRTTLIEVRVETKKAVHPGNPVNCSPVSLGKQGDACVFALRLQRKCDTGRLGGSETEFRRELPAWVEALTTRKLPA